MAYPAVISLKNTMLRLLDSSRISFVSPSLEILISACAVLNSLQKKFEQREGKSERESKSERWKFLDGEVREAVFKLEDLIESQISSETLASQSESHPLTISVDEKELRDAVACLSDTAQKMVEYNHYFDLQQPEDEEEEEEEEDGDLISSTAYVGGDSPTEMVGFTEVFAHIRDELLKDWRSHKYFPIVGMAGIGKTTLAKKILEDPLVMEKFDYRFFVPVGQGSGGSNLSNFYDVQRAVVEQLKGDEFESFCERNYLIVFDDVWEPDPLPYTFKGLPPGSAIIVTSRIRGIGISLTRNTSNMRFMDIEKSWNRLHMLNPKKTFNNDSIMRFMNIEESWNLLRRKVFGEEVFPYQLEKAGKKIAKNCAGLPLLIVTVADLLSRAARTPEHWEKVAAADIHNPIFEEAFDRILEVLYPSYYFLPHYAKPCFLYMAVFRPSHQVNRSRLFTLWSVEEFIDSDNSPDSCLKHLINGNVVVVRLKGSKRTAELFSLHPVFWYLCKKEAGNNKLLHILNKYDDCLAENIESQRRLSIYKNVLFGIKDVYNAVASVSNARSLLCTGAYHQYQVPICFGSWRLLRVLDALTIRFYEFPMEVVELVLLRYLSLTSNDNLPPSISKLWSLRFLIVHQHMSIKITLAESYLPIEIWQMQELEHLEVRGRNLPDPPHGAILPKLLKLLDVGPHSCSNSVLKCIPNLDKLRVGIEFTPGVAKTFNCFDHIFDFCESGRLQIIVVNPEMVAFPPLPIFKSHLRKLTLSGCGYPWKDLNKLGELQLEVLKLQCYAFRGEKWVTQGDGFQSLRYLLIEDSDLVKWRFGRKCEAFKNIEHLTLKHCYKLQDFPLFPVVELFDCSLEAVIYARRTRRSMWDELYIDCSWDR